MFKTRIKIKADNKINFSYGLIATYMNNFFKYIYL